MFFAVSQDNFFFMFFLLCVLYVRHLWPVFFIFPVKCYLHFNHTRDKFHTSISMMEYNLLDQAGSVDRSRDSVFRSINATGCIINLTQHDEQLPIPM